MLIAKPPQIPTPSYGQTGFGSNPSPGADFRAVGGRFMVGGTMGGGGERRPSMGAFSGSAGADEAATTSGSSSSFPLVGSSGPSYRGKLFTTLLIRRESVNNQPPVGEEPSVLFAWNFRHASRSGEKEAAGEQPPFISWHDR